MELERAPHLDTLRPARSRLIAREHELDLIRTAVEEARTGRGRLIAFEGAPGIGKTRLLETARELCGDEVELRAASGNESEREVPFGGLAQLLGQAPAAGLTTESLHAAIVAREGRGTLVLCVDDAQAVDDDTLCSLHFLARRAASLPVVILLATEPLAHGAAGPLTAAVTDPATTRIVLGPFSPEATQLYVREVLPGAADRFCAACHDAAGGNPRLLQDLVADVVASGLEPNARAAGAIAGRAPDGVAAWVLRRVAGFGADAVALMRAAATLGDGAELRRAARLAAIEQREAARLCAALSGLGLLTRSERISFAQPVVREAIYMERHPAQRGQAHLSAAGILLEEGDPAAADHLLRARRSGHRWVIEVLSDAAADAVARRDAARAIAYLRRALEEPPPPSRLEDVLLTLARVEAMAGDPAAESRYEQVIQLAPDANGRATLVLERGRLQVARGAGADAAFDLPSRDRDALGGDLAARLDGARNASSLLQLKRSQADDAEGAHAQRAAASLAAAYAGESRAEVLALAERALADGVLLSEQTGDSPAMHAVAVALALADELAPAEAALAAGIADARARGSRLGEATNLLLRSLVLLPAGRLSEAESDAEAALAADRNGWRFAPGAAAAVLAGCAIERGDTAAAARQLARVPADELDVHLPHLVPVTRGRLELALGHAAEARDAFLESGRILEGAGVSNPALAPWRGGAALASAALGQQEEAADLADTELALARAFAAPAPIARALLVKGKLGGPDAADAFGEAVSLLGDSEAWLVRAHAEVEYGAALRRMGRRGEAAERLRPALQLADRLGAAALATRVRAELRAAGARPRRAAAEGLPALTPRQADVIARAARGMSNREIAGDLVVTVKTVEWHLANAFQKLGVRSRAELRDVLRAPAPSEQGD